WHRRGYYYCGLDLSPPMLDNARAKAARLGIAADFVAADMRDFDPGKIGRGAELLPSGGLYLLDSVVWSQLFGGRRRGWTRRRDGVRVRMRYRAEIVDAIAQTYDECVTLDVDDHGTAHKIE